MKRAMRIGMGAVTLGAGGILGILYVCVGLIFAVGTLIGIWLLSDIFYAHGLWPLGAIARIVAWFMVLGMGIWVLMVVLVCIGFIVRMVVRAFSRGSEQL